FRVECWFCCERKVCCAPERSEIPLQGRASGSHHLPWALLRVLHAIAKIKRVAGESARDVGHGCADVCSKAVSSVFIRGSHGNGTAAKAAGRRRGSGRDGRRNSDTAKSWQANRNATGKAGATASASRTANYKNQKQLTCRRG